MSEDCILAIDQGTSSSRCVLFDARARVLASAQREFPQHYPRPGWVEHSPDDIWASVYDTMTDVIGQAGGRRIAGIGITNQRETTLVWEKDSGRCLFNAIVWQDRRTAERCRELRAAGHDALLRDRTGLRLDPYFSATKLQWILEHVDGAAEQAAEGRLAFGTVDSYLVWRLTEGRVHATDVSNASRTALYNIHTQEWDAELLALFGVPESMLPEVRDCADDFGVCRLAPLSRDVPIAGVAGDQQAALIGQAGLEPGVTKSTYGTGCFVIAHTGDEARRSDHQLLTTIASRIDGRVQYGLEGSVFVAGSAIQWLRDELGLIAHASETGSIAAATGVVEDVVVVPAFAGLGAPYWDPDARGAILGLTRGTNRRQIVTATLQAVALQTADLLTAMRDDGVRPSVIRVDGGMVANDWFLQFLADILDLPVERPEIVESTVLGAAFLAAYRVGLVGSIAELADIWKLERRFEPAMSAGQRKGLLAGWQAAVARVRVAEDEPA